MNLIRWNPFGELETFGDRINRLFGGTLVPGGTEEVECLWEPTVDIREDNDTITVKAELPEMEEKDVHINVENNVLTLRGERKLEHEEKKEEYHLIESTYGSFYRAFTLPLYAEADKITAKLEKGVLRITIPKREETKPKEIEVKAA